MVQDKANKTITDLTVSPVNPLHLSISYYIATLISTLTVCMTALAICLVYAYITGWFLAISDILFLILDVFLLVCFGTALSSIINFFLSSQGQISAVGTIVSSGYGFICGAYMPISQFSKGLQRVISFFPGTYGTSLVKNHAMRGVFKAMESEGLPTDAIDSIKTVVDCKIKFFDNDVSVPAMLTVLLVSITVLVSVYVIINFIKYRRRYSK
ncbi:MAG: ABC transporter permease [Clostridia bacterium]|nr:ABC transporter permease [Clostridia bacterium]